MSFDHADTMVHVYSSLFTKNRARLVDALRGKVPAKSVVVLQGEDERWQYISYFKDFPFRQESFFFWAFGVHESGFYAAIDIDTGQSMLFPPLFSPDVENSIGSSGEWLKKKYSVDQVYFNDGNTIENVLTAMGAARILLLKDVNSEIEGALRPTYFHGIKKFTRDEATLFPVMAELRVFKTAEELEVMRHAAKLASDAHKTAMKHIKPGMTEYQLESMFHHKPYYHGGCLPLAPACVDVRGCDTPILNYGHIAHTPTHSREIKDGEMCLFDMGPEYNCYASDVTTTFPANGKFTDKQKLVYNAVLDAKRAVFMAAKPGVRWTAMHELAEKVILHHLKEAGLLVGDVDEMVKARLGAVFMPHGLGHFIGLDVHDVGGFLGDALPRSILPGLKNLRTTRTLQERMTITIEPGCYFIGPLIDAALADKTLSKFLVAEKVDEFRGQGGVRIEDDVIIWANGNEIINQVPRTVEGIENFMAAA